MFTVNLSWHKEIKIHENLLHSKRKKRKINKRWKLNTLLKYLYCLYYLLIENYMQIQTLYFVLPQVRELNASSRRIVLSFPYAVKIFSRVPTYRSSIEVYLPRRIRIWLITRKRESCYHGKPLTLDFRS